MSNKQIGAYHSREKSISENSKELSNKVERTLAEFFCEYWEYEVQKGEETTDKFCKYSLNFIRRYLLSFQLSYFGVFPCNAEIPLISIGGNGKVNV